MFKFFMPLSLAFLSMLFSGVVFADGETVTIAPTIGDVAFDVSSLFVGLIDMLMPCLAVAIGFGATIWAVGLIWRKTKSVAK
jgi:hypothetical protein